jgi:uncharacterized protein involved in type VI secretion and phage assembly
MIDGDGLERMLDWIRHRYFGKYRGTITDNADDTKRGRLKVKVPAVLGDLEVWAMPCVPYAGDKVGLFTLPDTGTGVWVEFEAGDPSFPIWAGFFWADGEMPGGSDAAVKLLATTNFTLSIDDNASEAKAEIKDGATLTVADSVKAEREQATFTVASDGVTSEIGSSKVEVTSSSVNVNNGALQVM